MAKNKKEEFDSKNVKINEEELAITKIGEITTTEQSPKFTILIFVVLLLFIFFLPTLVNLIHKEEEKPDYSLPGNSTSDNKDGQDKEEKPEESYYDFSETLSINLEKDIVIHHFKLEENNLTFTISNNLSTRYSFKEKNYFLELYTEENTLLERIILKKDNIAKESSSDFTYTISAATKENMKKIRFVEKEIADYPNIVIDKNEAGEEVLICSKEEDTITYRFQNQKLVSITDVFNVPFEDSDAYNQKLVLWQNRVAVYNNAQGVSSTFIDSGVGFIVNTVLDLKTAKVGNLENENYYAYETMAKVVKFEMDARGFRCR